MRICSIASGSSGNCIYIGDDKNHILIDAGISRKRIVDGLQSIGTAFGEIFGGERFDFSGRYFCDT